MKTITANDGKTYTLPAKPEWREGPPPEVGWWPASPAMNVCALRWWDGRCWSYAALPCYDARLAERSAGLKHIKDHGIRWTDRWWLTQPTTKKGNAA